jgi:hypothetical protein
VGGTSAGAPQWAALIAIADQGRALEGLGTLDGPSQTLPMLHNLPSSDFHTDIPGSNQNGVSGPGVIGLGTPYANLVVAGLAQEPTQAPPNNNPPPDNNPPPTYNPPPTDNPPTYNPPTYDPPNNPPNNSPPNDNPPPQTPTPMQLFMDGYVLAIDLFGAGGSSSALAEAALIHDMETVPGGLFNPYLDAGFSAALSALHGNHNN